MATIKHSYAWWAFAHKVGDPRKLLTESKKMGYHGVEMIPEEHWDLVKECGLEIATMGGHKSLEDGLNKPGNHERIENELKTNIDKAVKYGIPVLICFSGNRNGLPDDEGLDICAQGLDRVKGYAEQKKVTLAVELLNSKVNHPDYQCDHTAWGVELVKKVGSPRVKLLYDIYHMQIMEGDLIRNIQENIEHIAHFHTAGNPGRKDLDDQQEIYYPAVIRAIAGTDYSGFLGQEFSPKADALAALKHALDVCTA